MPNVTGFIAYPSNPPAIGQTIEAAVEDLGTRLGISGFDTWREADIAGRFISNEILNKIDATECLVADITHLNFNVVYEIGFALAKGKRVLLVKNSSMTDNNNGLSELGILDTLGYKTYQNASQLADLVFGFRDIEPIQLPTVALNTKAPVYLIEALFKTDAVTRIIARVKKARLFFRSFDPNEQPRLSAFEAIQQVGQSYGVLLHLLPGRV